MITSENLKRIYNEWANQEFVYKNIESSLIRIDTPFFDRHNDSLIIYAQIQNESSIILTDGGYILDDLETSGIYISRSKQRVALLQRQLRSYGVDLDLSNNDLSIRTDMRSFPNAKHRLLQAMLFTNDMFMLAKKHTANVFIEDISAFLEDNNIRAMQNISFTGRFGMSHKFEFSIPGIRNIPDKLIKTLNVPNNEMYAKALSVDVKNTIEVVDRPTKFYTFINDSDREIKPEISSLLQNENISIIPFSKRMEFVEELAQ